MRRFRRHHAWCCRDMALWLRAEAHLLGGRLQEADARAAATLGHIYRSFVSRSEMALLAMDSR